MIEVVHDAFMSQENLGYDKTIHYRLSTHYIGRMDHEELWRQWAWEPRMGESLILLLVEPEDVNCSNTN